MIKEDYKKIAKNVIDLEIKALKKLKKSISSSFNAAVKAIVKCQSKVILCGVGKSGLIAAKISATLSSVGTPSFSLSANDCSHGDLGSISKKDVLILISYSGSSEELKNIIKYANRNKIILIGIMSKKNSILYKAADIKLLIPEVIEAGLGIVPTSSTINQLSIGDALAVASLSKKKISKKDFKKYHPSGSLGAKLKTVEELMIKGKDIPFINENLLMKNALKIITQKKLGVLIVKNKQKLTKGIITDGQIRRAIQKNHSIKNLTVKKVMTQKPIGIDKNDLAAKALSIMNERKITILCVYKKESKLKHIRLFLIFLLILTSLLFVLYIKNKNNLVLSNKLLKSYDTNIQEKIEISNILEKIKYVSEDLKGNIYIIESAKGFVDQENPNIILMERVVGTINLSNDEIIKIVSDNARFNNESYETTFFNNVGIDYNEHIANADNLALSFANKYLVMKDNLIYKNSSLIVKSDILEIDFYKKISKMYMKDINKNVKIKNIE